MLRCTTHRRHRRSHVASLSHCTCERDSISVHCIQKLLQLAGMLHFKARLRGRADAERPAATSQQKNNKAAIIATGKGRVVMRCSLNLTAVMGCPWRQAVHRAQISFSSFCFFFWKTRTKTKIRRDASAALKKNKRSHRPRSGTEEGQMYRGCISVYVHAHSLPALRDSPRHGDSQ